MSPSAKDIYPSADPSFARFASRRSVVHSTKGMVASTQPLACRAGIKVLEQGGNAADAAVAMAAALNMTEPNSTGIGGDMFCLFYDAKEKKVRSLNGSGRSGANVSLENIRKQLHVSDGQNAIIPFTSVHAATIPGAAAGWVDTAAKFGSGKLSMEQILAPAIELGEEGFPVSQLAAHKWRIEEEKIKNASPNFAEMLKADKDASQGCRAPSAGELMYNLTLAKTFRSLAKEGKKGFYEGEIAQAIVKVVQDLGGQLTLEDLKHHLEVGSEEPGSVSLKFSGQGIKEPVELWEHPPNGQGLVALMALGMLQELEKAGKIPQFSHQDHNSVEYLHALIETFRVAFSDGTWFISDTSVPPPVPIQGLLDPQYLASRVKTFSKEKIMDGLKHGSPAAQGCNTVYFCTVDKFGNACSFMNSNYDGFGTGIIPRGCGFTLHNRGSNFTLHPPEHPNIYAPRKRPYHTIIPAMITNANDGSLHTCFGVMAQWMQPQGQVQVMLNMLVFGMNPQEALDAPRICVETRDIDRPGSQTAVDEVFVEEGVPNEVLKGLERLGHRVIVIKGYNRSKFGRGQIIRKHEEDGTIIWSGGSDSRGDGHAVPL